MIALGVALALVLMGALLSMLGSAWVGLDTTERLTLAGIMFVVILLLLGLDPISRRFRGP